MKKPGRIFVNAAGFTDFDDYFVYINDIAADIPARLAEFFGDEERYALRSPITLHDSWLKKLEISTCYNDNECQTSVEIVLLHAMHEKSVHLWYRDVVSIEYIGAPIRWPSHAVDLLVHEFSQEAPGAFRHYMEFDRGVCLSLLFGGFEFEYRDIRRDS